MIALGNKLTTVALVVMALAVVGSHYLAADALEVERACSHVTRNFMSPDSCKRCCTNEGYKQSFFTSGQCQCLVASQERKKQEAALKASTHEHVCSHLSGASHEQVDGLPKEIACNNCCRENSFRTSTFNVDHHFAASVGASVRGTGATSVRSECLCEGLTLKFVSAEESQQ